MTFKMLTSYRWKRCFFYLNRIILTTYNMSNKSFNINIMDQIMYSFTKPHIGKKNFIFYIIMFLFNINVLISTPLYIQYIHIEDICSRNLRYTTTCYKQICLSKCTPSKVCIYLHCYIYDWKPGRETFYIWTQRCFESHYEFKFSVQRKNVLLSVFMWVYLFQFIRSTS